MQNSLICSIISSRFLLNDASDGKSWAEHGVHKAQVCKRNERIADTSDIVWEKMLEIMDKHVEKGNLKNV